MYVMYLLKYKTDVCDVYKFIFVIKVLYLHSI